MLTSEATHHVRHYVEDAQSAMQNIEQSLGAVGKGWDDVVACLDYASGYGRVTRWLAEVLTARRVTVCDLDKQAVRFCVAEFGVTGLYAAADPRRIRFPATYDLIFVGSLLTHLPREDGLALLDVLSSVLDPGGLLIFSTQGESCLNHLDWYGHQFAEAEAYFRAGVARDGAHFVPYQAGSRCGITIHAVEALERDIERRLKNTLALVRFALRGWDRHQDVWTYQRMA